MGYTGYILTQNVLGEYQAISNTKVAMLFGILQYSSGILDLCDSIFFTRDFRLNSHSVMTCNDLPALLEVIPMASSPCIPGFRDAALLLCGIYYNKNNQKELKTQKHVLLRL